MAHGENNYSYNPHARGCDKKNLALKMFSSRILMGTKGGLKHLSIVFLFAYIGEALFVRFCVFLFFMRLYIFVFGYAFVSLVLAFHSFLLF